jgi:hypothetical protein
MYIKWSDFKELVKDHTPVEADRENVAVISRNRPSYYDLLVRAGYVNLQRYIQYYRTENQTLYTFNDIIQEGQATKFSIPENAKIKFAKLVFNEDNTTSQAVPVSWHHRQTLIQGDATCPAKPLMAISPEMNYGYIYPSLRDSAPDQTSIDMILVWDGVKQSIADDEIIKGSEEEAEAVSYYVLWKLNRQVDEVGIGDRMKQDWLTKRRELWVLRRSQYDKIER